MSILTIELPVEESYHATNLRRWEELMEDRSLSDYVGKIETNRHGNTLMMPPPGGNHSRLQGEIGFQLRTILGGKSLPECPVSTINGVKAVDVGWFSDERSNQVRDQKVFEQAPEICVEVLSPSNSPAEMEEKKSLYFEAGADEVWICAEDGKVDFYTSGSPTMSLDASVICPDFPRVISK